MITVGYRTRVKEIGRGRFLCPNCRGMQNYKRKRIAPYTTLYFIPLFQIGPSDDIVRCQNCLRAWKPEVLGPDPVSHDEQIPDRGRKTPTAIASAAAKPKAPANLRVDYKSASGQGSHAGDSTMAASDGLPDP
jgi:predicted Zn finger-like uncharacterized protein